MVLAVRRTVSPSALATATPKRVVLPDMKDMNSCENSRKPIESAQPASAASARAKGMRERGSAGKDLSRGASGFAGPRSISSNAPSPAMPLPDRPRRAARPAADR